MSALPDRSEVDDEHTWDLDDIYATDEDWERAYEAVENGIDDLTAYEGRLLEDGETLHEALQTRDDLMRRLGTVHAYARMRSDEDTTDETYQEISGRADTLAAQVRSAASFIDPELQRDPDRVRDLLETTPELDTYEHYLDDVLRVAEHTRSGEVEALLADLSDVTDAPGEIYRMLANADMTFPTVEDSDGEAVEITTNNFTRLQRDPDRDFRQRVYEAFYDRWTDVKNTVATSYAKSVRTDVRLAEIRDYDSAVAAALDGSNIPVDVYDTLLETVRGRLAPLHRHAELKGEHVGADEVRMWDLYVPLTETEYEMPYAEAREHVVEALAPLGEDYQQRVREGLDGGWVDVYETAGKRSGAYSGGTYDTDPYILMNYQDDVASMYTLAHELGHSLHTQLRSESQPYVYGGTDIFVAEVASTVNEALLTRHLVEHADDDRLRRHALNEQLERFRSTLYRQTMFAAFERAAHEHVEADGALTAGWLDEQYHDLKTEFYAPATADERIGREWMRIPHFYRAFYVYQYATGLSAAVALSEAIQTEGEPARDRYLEMLRRGDSAYPLALLADAGVDMTDSAPIETALDRYDAALDEMAALL
jgi:oligoendopeptidase F